MTNTRSYGIQLSKKQIYFISMILIILLLLIFSLGVVTGIRFTQRKKSDELASSPHNTPAKTSPMDHSDFELPHTSHPEEEKNLTRFTFYDTLLKNSETQLSRESKKEEVNETLSTTISEGKKEEKSNQEMGRKKYTIQFASFQQREKAYALQNQLKKQGFLVYVISENIPERGIWYRVRMGKFDTPEEAQQWISKLGDLSPPPFITSATE